MVASGVIKTMMMMTHGHKLVKLLMLPRWSRLVHLNPTGSGERFTFGSFLYKKGDILFGIG